MSFEDFVKLFAKNTKVKIQKTNLENAYDDAKHNPSSVYSLESLNILVGDYTSSEKQLQKLSNVELTEVSRIFRVQPPFLAHQLCLSFPK